MLGAEISTSDVFLWMLVFFVFVIWIWLVFTLLSDTIRSPDLTGWGKAGWSLCIIVLPFVGTLAYLVVRGDTMSDRMTRLMDRRSRAFEAYTLGTAPSAAIDLDPR